MDSYSSEINVALCVMFSLWAFAFMGIIFCCSALFLCFVELFYHTLGYLVIATIILLTWPISVPLICIGFFLYIWVFGEDDTNPEVVLFRQGGSDPDYLGR